MKKTLLTTDVFKSTVFHRDGGKCVSCGAEAVEAHRIIDRSLWVGGGNYTDNGASVCKECHLKCETTEISVEEIRNMCGITNIIVPESFDVNTKYDKWGNEILKNGTRIKGFMFFDEGVQRILNKANMLELFTDLVKYPRTPHIPMSDGVTEDDKVLFNLKRFVGRDVVITEKMDGENTTLYKKHAHARSLDSRNHPSRNLLKSFHASICHDIPERMRICGENMYAKHSIQYFDIPHHFLGFSMWNEKNKCLSWDDTLEWFELLGIQPVREIWRGEFSEGKLAAAICDLDLTKQEGLVIRVSDGFHYSSFNYSVAKYVRGGHVTTKEHWMDKPIIKNSFIC